MARRKHKATLPTSSGPLTRTAVDQKDPQTGSSQSKRPDQHEPSAQNDQIERLTNSITSMLSEMLRSRDVASQVEESLASTESDMGVRSQRDDHHGEESAESSKTAKEHKSDMDYAPNAPEQKIKIFSANHIRNIATHRCPTVRNGRANKIRRLSLVRPSDFPSALNPFLPFNAAYILTPFNAVQMQMNDATVEHIVELVSQRLTISQVREPMVETTFHDNASEWPGQSYQAPEAIMVERPGEYGSKEVNATETVQTHVASIEQQLVDLNMNMKLQILLRKMDRLRLEVQRYYFNKKLAIIVSHQEMREGLNARNDPDQNATHELP